MKPIVKKAVSVLLVLVCTVGGIGMISANAVTAYEILDKLAVLDSNGSTWGSYGNLKPGSSFTNGECWQYVKGVSSYVYGTTVSIPNTASYLGGGSLGEYYRVRAALTNCSYEQIVELLKLSQPGDIIGFKNSKVDATYGHIMFIGNNTGKKITFYQAASGYARKDTIDLTVAGLKSLYSFGYSGNASFASSSYGISLFRCNRRTGQSDWVYTDEPSTPQTPPGIVPDLRTDKSVYTTSESIHFYWTAAAGATEHWIYLWKDGVQLYAYNCGTATEFTQAPSSPGSYTMIIRPGNSAGFNDGSPSWSFVVTDGIPAAITDLKSEKRIYNSSESVTFTWSKPYGAEQIWVYLWKDGQELYSMNCGTSTSFTQAPSAEGNYTLIIRPGNSYGFNDGSPWYSYVVTNSKPAAPTIVNNERDEYKVSDVIETRWDAANLASGYQVYLWRGASQISNSTVTEPSYRFSPSENGVYAVVIYSFNSNGYSEAAQKTFYIGSYTVSFQPNGGNLSNLTQIKTHGKPLKLNTAIPERTGYTFVGWNTKADGSGTDYAPGADYMTDADVTLYSQWIPNPPVVNPATDSNIAVNESTHFVYGLSAGGTAQGCVSVTDGTATYEYPTAKQVMGTGTKIKVYNIEQTLVDTYTVVIFGDVDGDSWYDGTDAYFVRLVANGLIARSALTDAQLAACDANHDGTIDAADVNLIEKAGLLLAQVDQTLPSEELQTDSAYLEYCSLIDQSVEITEPATDEPTQIAEPRPAAQSILARFSNLFQIILNWIYRIFNLQMA